MNTTIIYSINSVLYNYVNLITSHNLHHLGINFFSFLIGFLINEGHHMFDL